MTAVIPIGNAFELLSLVLAHRREHMCIAAYAEFIAVAYIPTSI